MSAKIERRLERMEALAGAKTAWEMRGWQRAMEGASLPQLQARLEEIRTIPDDDPYESPTWWHGPKPPIPELWAAGQFRKMEVLTIEATLASMAKDVSRIADLNPYITPVQGMMPDISNSDFLLNVNPIISTS